MGELVNLLMGAALPSAPIATTSAPGTTENAGAAPSSGSFQMVIAALTTAVPGTDVAVESWAGQQVAEDVKPGEGETGKTPDQPTADLLNLLGSSLQTPPANVAVPSPMTMPTITPDPHVNRAVPATEQGDSPVQVQPSPDAPTAGQSLPSVGTPVVVQQATLMPSTRAAADPDTVLADQSQPSSVPVTSDVVLRAAQPTGEAIPVNQAEPSSVVTEPAPTPAPPVTTTAADQAALPTTMTQPEAESPTPVPVGADPDAEPIETPLPDAPVFIRSSDDRGKARASLGDPKPAHVPGKQPIEVTLTSEPVKPQPAPDVPDAKIGNQPKPADASRREAASPIEIAMPATQSAEPVDQPVVVKSPMSVQQLVRELLATGEKAATIERSSEDADLGSTKQDQSNSSAALQDLRPSFERSVDGASKSNGFQAPERVVEQKVIAQIVRAAKVNLVDGGATISLRLDPPHLGTVQMTVTAQQGVVTANLQTSTETAKQVLEADLALLRQSLSEAGIVVDTVNVSVGSGGEYDRLMHGGAQGGRPGHGPRGNAGSGNAYGAEENDNARSTDRSVSAGALDYMA